MTTVAIESTSAEIPLLAALPPVAPASTISATTGVLSSARFTRSPLDRCSSRPPTFGKHEKRSRLTRQPKLARQGSVDGGDRPAEHERTRLHRGGVEHPDLVRALRVPEVDALRRRLVEDQETAAVDLHGNAALPRSGTLNRPERLLGR